MPAKSTGCKMIDSIPPNYHQGYSYMIDSIYQTFNIKQALLFNGYFRKKIPSEFKECIPIDIIHLCQRFLMVDFKSLSQGTPVIYGCNELYDFADKDNQPLNAADVEVKLNALIKNN